MFKFLRNKLLNKKWLNACLLLGIVLLVAVASCNPMFKNGAMDMTLASKFDSAIEDNNTYSAVVGRQGSAQRTISRILHPYLTVSMHMKRSG